ncbi:hypothetical protein PTT_20181 [Pyrenophora teres f. teres 0-1]|uniref:Uncharacterized protein n=1 Tax=Pyrenophora teres f. teres (strain 0-1) TaxID=861557 RepID=E3SAI0_PYRTT|nr:hypothetical protein PTT_20181 [Pyrenophora teres f. teres 0-1]
MRSCIQTRCRPVNDDDIGLKVLREAPGEAAQSIDIFAIHGLGAHPDDSWCANVGTGESPRPVNWLMEESMLPAVTPNARIMRYGYHSQWFDQEMMQRSVSIVAERLLKALKRTRKDVPFRPLMFIARCFGGLVMLEATRCEYHEDQVQPTVLEVLQPGNVYLREVVDSYLKKIRGQINKTEIACFFELKPSNGGMIVGKEDRKWALKGGA